MASLFKSVSLSPPPAQLRLDAWYRWLKQSLHRHAEAVLCRGTALALMANLILRPGRFPPAARVIGRAYMFHFWRPTSAGEWLDIVAAILLWPLAVITCGLWYTRKNGAAVAEQSGRSRISQFGDQLRLSTTSGLLPPWYYIFELYRPGEVRRARAYLTRGETKHGAYILLANARGSSSPLGDKEAFAQFCAERQVNALPVLLSVHDGDLRWGAQAIETFPERDLFVKPVHGRGGRGAERWDYAGNGAYANCENGRATAAQLIEHLRRLSQWQPYLVQERARNHPAMRDVTNGALSTIRMISCLDEREQPELIGAVLRMAIGENVTVDNVHAGAIAASLDLAEGRLGQATYMGIDATRPWIDRHPDSGGRITDRIVPMWGEVCDLVRRAHCAFEDWVVIGWDVAITAEGALLVEGNSGPDIDLIQRPLRTALGDSRLGELLAYHLARSEPAWRL
jgi:hypothetical protein